MTLLSSDIFQESATEKPLLQPFKQMSTQESQLSEGEQPVPRCPICYVPYGEPALSGHPETAVITACGHIHGSSCLDDWLCSISPVGTCPTCRTTIRIDGGLVVLRKLPAEREKALFEEYRVCVQQYVDAMRRQMRGVPMRANQLRGVDRRHLAGPARTQQSVISPLPPLLHHGDVALITEAGDEVSNDTNTIIRTGTEDEVPQVDRVAAASIEGLIEAFNAADEIANIGRSMDQLGRSLDEARVRFSAISRHLNDNLRATDTPTAIDDSTENNHSTANNTVTVIEHSTVNNNSVRHNNNSMENNGPRGHPLFRHIIDMATSGSFVDKWLARGTLLLGTVNIILVLLMCILACNDYYWLVWVES